MSIKQMRTNERTSLRLLLTKIGRPAESIDRDIENLVKLEAPHSRLSSSARRAIANLVDLSSVFGASEVDEDTAETIRKELSAEDMSFTMKLIDGAVDTELAADPNIDVATAAMRARNKYPHFFRSVDGLQIEGPKKTAVDDFVALVDKKMAETPGLLYAEAIEQAKQENRAAFRAANRVTIESSQPVPPAERKRLSTTVLDKQDPARPFADFEKRILDEIARDPGLDPISAIQRVRDQAIERERVLNPDLTFKQAQSIAADKYPGLF